MISYRTETQMTPDPPVRFYKIIAVTFFCITVVLLLAVMLLTTKKASITIMAKEDAKVAEVGVPIAAAEAPKTLAGTVAAEQFYWSKSFNPTGTKTIEGVAKGTVTIYNKTAQTQPLVKTTRLLTKDGALFRLSERVVVPPMGSTTAKVYADQAGAASEIGPSQFTIPGLSPEKQKEIYAESFSQMTGGRQSVGVLSAEDIKSAEQSYREEAEKAFLEGAAGALTPGTGAVAAISSLSAKSNRAVGEEVGEFVLSGTSTMVLVKYPVERLNKLVDEQVGGKIDLSAEKFLAAGEGQKIFLSAFDLAAGTATLTARRNVNVTLDANADALAAAHFFGKTKEEIERYVLSLPHVASAEVKFSPRWTITAPSVANRIKVVVKNVQ